MANIYGVSAYQQTNSSWKSKTNSTKAEKTSVDKTGKQEGVDSAKELASNKATTFKSIDSKSSLIPTNKSGYGVVVGNVELSDGAKDYYDKLKSKYHNMDFILVSKDMKASVQANAAAYGNASKPVVLIDEEKIEKMATDKDFRNKYEGLIAMGQQKLQEAKNSLASSGANVTNFGISVDANGKTSFFATIEKQNDAKAAEKKATQLREKKAAEKKANDKKAAKKLEEKKIKEKKEAEKLAEKQAKNKKEAEKLTEKKPEDQKVNEVDSTEKADADTVGEKNSDTIWAKKKYVEFKADSMDELVNKVSSYAYNNSARNVLTESEQAVGQQFDFRG